jgi:hypothetical protein
MNIDKKFFRVKLNAKCSVNTKMVNSVTLTKQWQMKVGKIGDFSKFPDVDTQVMVKQGNIFVAAEEAPCEAKEGSGGSSDDANASMPTVGGQTANTAILPPREPTDIPNFAGMTVEQLKNFLTANGVAPSELRNTTKPDLIERAEFVWSQNN